jgi:hypothetical protein
MMRSTYPRILFLSIGPIWHAVGVLSTGSLRPSNSPYGLELAFVLTDPAKTLDDMGWQPPGL